MNTHLVFVYGSLMYGYWNHDLLEYSTLIGTYRTGPLFKLYDGSFPVAIESNDGAPIIGELYEVDDETLENLDYLEGHPHFYERVQTAVIRDGESVTAWIYIGRSAGYSRSEDDLIPLNSRGELYWGGE